MTTPTVNIEIELDKDLIEQLDRLAKKTGKTWNEVVIEALEMKVEALKEEEG